MVRSTLSRFTTITAGAFALGMVGIAFANINDDAKPAVPVLDAAARQFVIEKLSAELESTYVFPDVAKKMSALIAKKLADHGYDSANTGQAFAEKLTADLQSISKDKHLRVRYSEKVEPKSANREPTTADMKRMRAAARWRNAQVIKVERLPGNIGYIDLRGFPPPEALAEPYAAAMNLLANTEALILDLRKNGGGSPHGVQLVCSYLFPADAKVHLNSIYNRPDDETREFWTLKEVAGKRYLNKDVFVLTSRYTFSGAEECAYNLQTQKRATLVGETTGGGAHPGGTVPLDDHFTVFVPNGRAINPITKTNWEGTGVKPEVDADADHALDVAHQLAVKKVRESTKDADTLRMMDNDLEADKRLNKRYGDRKTVRGG